MSREDSAPIEKLFGSKTRAKLLELFFSNTSKSYYVREITRVIEEQINSVRRELINLEGIGIVKSDTYDNKVYYSANMKSPYAHAFQEIFSPHRMVTPGNTGNVEVRRILRRMGNWEELIRPVEKQLKALIVINRFPGQDGLDMLIVGDDSAKKLSRWAEVVEKRQGRPMNYVIMSRDDYLYRRSVRDKFIAEVLDMEIAELYDPEKLVHPE
jgi:DNA-binding transcriptional ArsR family regulator